MVAWFLFSKAYLITNDKPDVSLLMWAAAPRDDHDTRLGADAAVCGCKANSSTDLCRGYTTQVPSWGRFSDFSCLSLPPRYHIEDASELFVPTALQVLSCSDTQACCLAMGRKVYVGVGRVVIYPLSNTCTPLMIQ
jgi:hypothetical protein